MHPPITPYALDILSSYLQHAGFQVEVLDLTFDPNMARVRDYFAKRRPILVGVTIRNSDTFQPQEQRVFLEDHLEIINEIKRVTDAPIVAGGAGFSSMPYALLPYFDIPYAVKGPGEFVLCELARAIARGNDPSGIAGLLSYDGKNVLEGQITASSEETVRYERRSNVPWRVDNLEYYQKGGLGNILTKNGCPFRCLHCTEPDAKGRRLLKRDAQTVVDEMEALASQGVLDLHTTDSEFNLSISHSKAILKEMIARRNGPDSTLDDARLWAYAHPVPFDEEFAELLAEAGCKGVSLAAEHFCREHLATWDGPGQGRTFYTADDVKRVVRCLSERDILVTMELLLGFPGETIDTVKNCIDESLAINPTVVGFTVGLRVTPYTPLGIRLAAESNGKSIKGLQSNTAVSPIRLKPLDRCANRIEYERQFMFDESGRMRPVFYFSPELPESQETIKSPNGRWNNTIRFINEYIPVEEHYRCALPTVSGYGKDENNYADSFFLKCMLALGYKGAFYSKWREREQIIKEAQTRLPSLFESMPSAAHGIDHR